jgi:hypothetical protein
MLETMDRFILEAAANGNGRNGARPTNDHRRHHVPEPEYAVAGDYN